MFKLASRGVAVIVATQPIGIVFLALLGGVAAFGVIGVLLGPLVVTFLIAALRIWRRDVEDRDDELAGKGEPGAGI